MRAGNRTMSGRRSARILIVDDHPLVCRGLEELISLQSDLEVCGEAGGMAEALTIVESQKPDLMIIDLKLREGSGLELIKQIKARFPNVKMLVSSMYEEQLFAERVLRAGASGYINKQESTEQVVEAVRQILNGKVYLSNTMTEHMLYQLAVGPQEGAPDAVGSLSDRELQVFELFGQGLGTRQIADRLNLSIKTIETYRATIKQKLNLNTSRELVRRAVQWVLEER